MLTVYPLANEVARARVTVSPGFTVVETVAAPTTSVAVAPPPEATKVTE
jgi:hypothetical protein